MSKLVTPFGFESTTSDVLRGGAACRAGPRW
jgi:hypothetical protein